MGASSPSQIGRLEIRCYVHPSLITSWPRIYGDGPGSAGTGRQAGGDETPCREHEIETSRDRMGWGSLDYGSRHVDDPGGTQVRCWAMASCALDHSAGSTTITVITGRLDVWWRACSARWAFLCLAYTVQSEVTAIGWRDSALRAAGTTRLCATSVSGSCSSSRPRSSECAGSALPASHLLRAGGSSGPLTGFMKDAYGFGPRLLAALQGGSVILNCLRPSTGAKAGVTGSPPLYRQFRSVVLGRATVPTYLSKTLSCLSRGSMRPLCLQSRSSQAESK